MDGRASRILKRAATVALLALALGIASYGLYLVVVGQQWMVVQEAVPLDEPPGTARVETMPAPQGLIPLAGGALIVGGIAARRLVLAWVGAAIITLFAALFLFSVGGILLAVAPVLLVLLSIVTWVDGSRRSGALNER
jgi:hypothetical protein